MTGKEGGNESRQYSVWSDLRAMKFLGQVQQDMRGIKTSTSRLQLWLGVSVVILGGAAIALTVALVITYNQLQDVRRQIQPQGTTRLSEPETGPVHSGLAAWGGQA